MDLYLVYAILSVFVGCGLNTVFLEHIVKVDPGAGNLITACQFIFIALYGFVFTARLGKVKPNIDLKNYVVLAFLLFVTSVVGNWTFSFHIPVPLHIIFRSGSLIANMLMGRWILKREYPLSKYISVAVITIGIIICTLYSSRTTSKACSECGTPAEVLKQQKQEADNYFWWIVGIFLIIGTLLLAARMGIYQESMYTTYGKYPEEALYYTHLFSLPGFLLPYSSIWKHAVIASESQPYSIPLIGLGVPVIWIYLLLNIITQYLCIKSVFELTAECSSLTVTLVVTLRKFLSIIFSVIYFQNHFSYAHWFGTSLVFVGTLLFADVHKKVLKIKEE